MIIQLQMSLYLCAITLHVLAPICCSIPAPALMSPCIPWCHQRQPYVPIYCICLPLPVSLETTEQ